MNGSRLSAAASHVSGFTRDLRTIQPLADALAILSRVMRGRTVQDWPALYQLGEFLDVEAAAAMCDHRLRPAGRSRETRAKQEDSCRWSIRKFLVTTRFFDRLAENAAVDEAEVAQEFYRRLYRQRGVVTWLVPLEGVPPQKCQLGRHVRLVVLTRPLVRELFRLVDPEECPIPSTELVGLCALEITVSSSSPSAWEGAEACADARQRIFEVAWPYLSLLLLHPHSDRMRLVALLESSNRIVDHPGVRVEVLSRPTRRRRLSGSGSRVLDVADDAPDVGQFVESLASCLTAALARSVVANQALHDYTDAIVALARHPLEEDLDEQMVAAVLLRFYQCLEQIFGPERRGPSTSRHIAACAARLFHGPEPERRRLHRLLSFGYGLPAVVGQDKELGTRGELMDGVRLVRQVARSSLVWLLQLHSDVHDEREEMG